MQISNAPDSRQELHILFEKERYRHAVICFEAGMSITEDRPRVSVEINGWPFIFCDPTPLQTT